MTSISSALREQIARLEGTPAPASARIVPTGVTALDAGLPWNGLPQGAVHEIANPDAADGAATGFVLRLLTQLQAVAPDKAVLWASCRDDLFAPGLRRARVDPGRLIFAHCRSGTEVLAALEDGLRCSALAAAVGEIAELDLIVSRRLQLAAVSSGVTLLLLRPNLISASAALTRWRVESCPSGRTVSLIRCRGGRSGQWINRNEAKSE